ncbi:hypothetical protein SSPIM334S_01711 [Streptomyces spiroverticillatus]
MLVLGFPWLVWKGPYLLDAKYLDPAELEKGSAALVTGLRTALVACIAAVGAAVALLYTARTYRLTRRGQITERFTKALERLGSTQRYVRIGGILALEQIVKDAPEQAATDAARVLGHFLRDRAPKAALLAEGRDPEVPLPQVLGADVQAALTALTRRESRTHVDPREVLDLSGLHLAGAHLREADLTGAELFATTLTGADLSGATLTQARLTDATLTGADLSEATLTRAHLSGATLTDARLADATLTGTDLFGATLAGAILPRATLTGADLLGANLSGANLSGATLTDARLTDATLTGADLSEATLTGANLSATKLTDARLLGTTLTGADLSGATLTGANLCRADLSGVRGLTRAALADVRINEGTVLPGEGGVRAGQRP